jgi:hypothetical protein
MRALLVSGYAGEPDERGRRKPLTDAQRSVAEGAIMVDLTWLYEGVLIHGHAPGVDSLASALASVHGLAGAQIPMPAQWARFGKSAGMRRNECMVMVLRQLRDCGYECRGLVLPGPRSRGSWHMARLLRDDEITTTIKELP